MTGRGGAFPRSPGPARWPLGGEEEEEKGAAGLPFEGVGGSRLAKPTLLRSC